MGVRSVTGSGGTAFRSDPLSYLLEHATFFVEQLAIVGWETGQRAEFLVTETTIGRRLGRAGLGIRAPGVGEIGYWVDPAARNRGVATEAFRAVCRWAFTTLDLEIIEWRTEVGNVGSRRVAERAGFLVEATLRKRQVHRGNGSTSGLARCSKRVLPRVIRHACLGPEITAHDDTPW